MSGISSAFQNLETILCIKIAWCSLLIIMFLFMQKLAYDICWYKKKITRKQVYACCRKPLSWWLSNSEVTPLLTNWSLALSNRSGWFTFYHHCCGENFLVSWIKWPQGAQNRQFYHDCGVFGWFVQKISAAAMKWCRKLRRASKRGVPLFFVCWISRLHRRQNVITLVTAFNPSVFATIQI